MILTVRLFFFFILFFLTIIYVLSICLFHDRHARLNTPTTFEMPLEVLGQELQFSQVYFFIFKYAVFKTIQSWRVKGWFEGSNFYCSL